MTARAPRAARLSRATVLIALAALAAALGAAGLAVAAWLSSGSGTSDVVGTATALAPTTSSAAGLLGAVGEQPGGGRGAGS